MQPAARNSTTGVALTAAQVTSLIRDTDALKISTGLELLDVTLTVLADLTDWFNGGTVERDSYATLHGTASLTVSQDLDWGTAILRPYMVLSDFTTSVRFNLGAYLASSPEAVIGESPPTHTVSGFDILLWLSTPVGEAYTVGAGTGYLAAVEAIMLAQGIVAYRIDQARWDATLTSSRTWVLNSQTTWLMIINDLLQAIGYRGIYSDWDGILRVEPYLNPSDRPSEWVYDAEAGTSMLDTHRVAVRDFFNAPNRWVFFTSPDPAGEQPMEGDGIYTFVNDRLGPTSVAARGRTITAVPQQVDAVDQPALVALAQASIDADLRLMTTYQIPTAPNPLHWHFDRITVNDSMLGPLSDILVTKWSLPLNGGNMSQEWSLLS